MWKDNLMTNLEVQTTIDNGGVGEIPDELIVSTLEDENDGDFSAGDLSLREAISIAESAAIITFDSNLSGGSITLNLSPLVINQDVNIQGLGVNQLSIDGNSTRSFVIDDNNIDSQINVQFNGLTIRNSEGIFNQENLTITDSALVENSGNEGYVVENTGRFQLNNSLLADNFGGGAAIINDGGTALISNSTITETTPSSGGRRR